MKPELNRRDYSRQKKLRKMLAAGLPLSALLTGLLGCSKGTADEPVIRGKMTVPETPVQHEKPTGQKPEPKPLAGVPPPPKPPVIRGALPPEPVYYEVRRGDNLYSIAKRHGTTIEQLKKLNGFSDKSASSLKAGQKIRIR